ncbi:hypothetical protein ScPMuIL_017599 [Solemya velum]
MSEAEVKKCREWLEKQQCDQETAAFGLNQTGVMSSIEKQKKRHADIVSYKQELDKVLKKPSISADSSKQLSEGYECLLALSSKRTACLEVISGIASLEDQIETLATDFDAKAIHLVNAGNKPCSERGNINQTNESMARAAQNCIVAVRNNWKWLDQVMKCSQKHLKNAADYHDFFHEVEEAEYWMNTTLSRMHLTFDKSNMSGDRVDVSCILDEMKDVLLAYLQWQTKVDSLFDKGKDVVPVRKRIEKQEDPLPVISLAAYRTDQIEFDEDESLTLMDNTNRTIWKVKNTRGQTADVPAVLLQIPAPYGEAVDAAVRLRIQLLSLWTASVKRLGYKMIAFMLLIFKDWSDEEIKSLQNMSPQDRQELQRVTQLIEDTLMPIWNGYRDFDELQEKISRLRTILEESPADTDSKQDQTLSTVVVQIKSLEDLINKYRDFGDYWETFKVIVELIKQPKYLLVCDKWEQLRFVTNAHFVKFWDTTLDVQDGPSGSGSSYIHEHPGDTGQITRGRNSAGDEGYWETDEFGQRVFRKVIWGKNENGEEGYWEIDEYGTRVFRTTKWGKNKDGEEGYWETDQFGKRIFRKGRRGRGRKGRKHPGDAGKLARGRNSADEEGYWENDEFGKRVFKKVIWVKNEKGEEGYWEMDEYGTRVFKTTKWGKSKDGEEGYWEIDQSGEKVFRKGTRGNNNAVARGRNSADEEGYWESDEFGKRVFRKVVWVKNEKGEEGYWEMDEFGKKIFRTTKWGKNKDGEEGYWEIDQSGEKVFRKGTRENNNAVEEDAFSSESSSRTQASYQAVQTAKKPYDARSSVSEIEEHAEAETDEVRTSTEEERSTFVIESLVDPRTNKEISVQEAIMAGILDQATGTYVNPQTGDSMPIYEAMNEHLIHVEFKSRRKIREEKKSYGIITIKVTRENRPYSMKKILCPATEEELEIGEAIDRGILDTHNSTYKTEKGDLLSIIDAIHSGLILVEFEGDRVGKPEVVQKTYAVSGVVDQRRKKKVPFSEAVRFGLLDKATGNYINNDTGETVPVTEAIMRGFIKARIIGDHAKLDIDPENRLVIERLETVKTKILRAIRTAKAFKEAAKEGKEAAKNGKEAAKK